MRHPVHYAWKVAAAHDVASERHHVYLVPAIRLTAPAGVVERFGHRVIGC